MRAPKARARVAYRAAGAGLGVGSVRELPEAGAASNARLAEGTR